MEVQKINANEKKQSLHRGEKRRKQAKANTVHLPVLLM